MRGLSIRQPFASLVACGAKRIETRSRRTHYRGPVLIHASAGKTRAEVALEEQWPFCEVLHPGGHDQLALPAPLPRGMVIAVAELVDCVSTDRLRKVIELTLDGKNMRPLTQGEATALISRDLSNELAFGDYASGRWGWVLDRVQRLPNPVSANGQLGLWRVPSDVEMPVLAQVDL